jgi:alpha-galactosidase
MAPLGIEYICLDAGWYSNEYPDTGDWRVNKTKFPRGLEPVAEAVKKNGMKMGLWFEPERVSKPAYEPFEHKEWLLADNTAVQVDGYDCWIVDLGRVEARQWMVKLIEDYAHRLDLRWIRWDFYGRLLDKWLAGREQQPERLGMKEIRYVEGLYYVLDALNRDCPNLLIEWCAGGGRRIDLNTLRRSHTFWKSDVTGEGDITRRHLAGGNMFLPGNYLNSNLIRLDSNYDYLCQFGGALGFSSNFQTATAEVLARTQTMIKIDKELRRFLVQDYYPLFSYSAEPDTWDGWQFHDPRGDEGFFVVLRPPASPYRTTEIRLQGLDPTHTYRLTQPLSDTDPNGAVVVVSGNSLAQGYAITLSSVRSGVLVRYSREKTRLP